MRPCAPLGRSRRLSRFLVFALVLAGLVVTTSPAQAQFDNLRDLVPDALHQTLFGTDAYQVVFEGELDPALRDILRSVSESHALRERIPATEQMFDRRARADIPNLLRALRSEGYYDGRVEARVDHQATPPRIVFQVQPGPAYLLQAVHFDGPDSEDGFAFPNPDPASAGLALGNRARAPEIRRGTDMFREFLRENGHPFPWVALREARVDHESRTLVATYTFNPGPSARFGPVTVEGEERVSPRYILDKIPWSESQPFRSSQLNRLRATLMQTDLFTMVDVSHPGSIPASKDKLGNTKFGNNELPVTISVVERVPRTVKAGVGYETDTGIGTALEWEHRNILGSGEQLRTRLHLAEKRQMLEGAFQIPEFPDPSQSLSIQGNIGQETTDALEKKEATAGAMINRRLDRFWTVGLGANFRYSEVTQLGETETYGLISTPGELTWDKRDSVLNPARGWRIQLRAEPFLDTLEWNTTFFKLSGSLSAFLPILAEDRLVLAGRGALGSITGEASMNLPPDQRFYAGGGGSVRGYAYQSIGPEVDGKVVGGKSMVEVSTELRLRLENNIGLVAFLDGGQVFSETELRFQDDFLWGAGLGLRYHLDFGPIRLDVAFPLNRRDKDDVFQVYVSIGQAY
ncbi:autotransporter assembly complex family protein [Desulfonatronum sp. SC1]|uniref:autotransporter assembly complex protein TamA n=1 Tax=Desulfonatronum sp. SC1 TaxID=2109626 RepID=UPI001304B1F9|nr:autotransporter assembly complex family protein [Desulfonatronum sp. SC1]